LNPAELSSWAFECGHKAWNSGETYMKSEIELRKKLRELEEKLIETEKPLPNEIYGTEEYFRNFDKRQNNIFLAQRIRSELSILEWILEERRIFRTSWE
jgi:hypothetical protein